MTKIDPRKSIEKELREAMDVLQAFSQDQKQIQNLSKAANLISSAIEAGGKVISCGNGGSMCDAMHFAEELMGKFREERTPVPAIAISDPSYLTCAANDYGYENIFSRYIEGLGKTTDILFAITTSGKSQNIVNALEAAKEKGMTSIALTGNDGGSVAALADLEIRVPHTGYADRIQEMHIKIIHILISLIEQKTSV